MEKKIMKPGFISKAISVLVAVGLWFFVSYAENPETELWFRDIPVSYVNEGTLAQKNIVRIKGENETVSVKVRGNRKAIMDLYASDIIATVDLNLVKTAKTYSLPITIKFPVDGLTVVDKKPYNITVATENRVTKEFPVEVLMEGKEKEGVKITQYESSLESVTVTGGESIINSAADCVAKLDVSEISSSRTMPVAIKLKLNDGTLYDGEGIEFSNTHTDISVKVDVVREVPVKAMYEDSVADMVADSKCDPAKIKISGSYEDVNKIQQIETHPIFLTGRYETEKITSVIVIPDGVENVDGITTVDVSTTISKDKIKR